jgi:hypothetical protein
MSTKDAISKSLPSLGKYTLSPSTNNLEALTNLPQGLLLSNETGKDITLQSGSSFSDTGGDVFLFSGNSETNHGGGITLRSGTTDETLGFTSGNITLETGASNRSGYILLKSGVLDYPTPTYGNIELVSQVDTEIRSGGRVYIAPLTSGGRSPGSVTIRGGNMDDAGDFAFQAGALNLEGGKALSGDLGSQTWGGDVNLKSYGYGKVSADGYGVYLRPASLGLNVHTQIQDGFTSSGWVTLRTGDGSDDTGASGDITLQTGQITGVPTINDASSSGDIFLTTSGSYAETVGSILLTTGKTIEGVSGDIELNTSDLDSALSSSGNILLETGANTSGQTGQIYIRTGTASDNVGGSLVLATGGITDGESPNGQGPGITLSAGPCLGTLPEGMEGGAVTIMGGSVAATNPDPTKTYRGGNVNISAGLGNDISGNVILSGEEVKLTTLTGSQDYQVPVASQTGALTAPGFSMLGVGSIRFTIPPSSYVFQLVLSMSNLVVNDGVNQQAVGYTGATLLYLETTEEYTGYGPVAPAFANFSPKVFFSVRTLSNGAFLEVPRVPLVSDTFFLLDGLYVNLIKFASAAAGSTADGLLNLNNTQSIEVEIGYMVMG